MRALGIWPWGLGLLVLASVPRSIAQLRAGSAVQPQAKPIAVSRPHTAPYVSPHPPVAQRPQASRAEPHVDPAPIASCASRGDSIITIPTAQVEVSPDSSAEVAGPRRDMFDVLRSYIADSVREEEAKVAAPADKSLAGSSGGNLRYQVRGPAGGAAGYGAAGYGGLGVQ
jgi:hypothetical protein